MEQLAVLSVKGLRLMGAGQELEFLAPVTEGMELVQETTVQDIQFREGKSGPMIIIRLQRVFKSNAQELVRCVETFIGR
jgi:hydroxyacyl-ACP dehydratase HTD2-like protein with hotdog domain